MRGLACFAAGILTALAIVLAYIYTAARGVEAGYEQAYGGRMWKS